MHFLKINLLVSPLPEPIRPTDAGGCQEFRDADHRGQKFMWSDRADEAYKRLTRTVTVPAGGATLSFWTSYNLELDFDYMIVEAHTVGQDDWTTLPDRTGTRPAT
jgi:bacillopeptidase F (M6 metalloprotease family)